MTARKKTQWTEKKIRKFILDGRGHGLGEDYIPWVQVNDFSNKGRGARLPGILSNRIHHTLSDLETAYYHILVWNENIIDIYEQFPLFPVAETEEIATSLGYRHPKNPGSVVNPPMTTDFLIVVQDEKGFHLEARNVKYLKDTAKTRFWEKYAIEEQYWVNRDIPFKLVTEESFNRIKADNIKMLLGYYEDPNIDGFEQYDIFYLEAAMLSQLENGKYLNLSSCVGRLDISLSWQNGSALYFFYYLAAHKRIPLKLDNSILATQPVELVIDWQALKSMPKTTPVIGGFKLASNDK